MTNHVLLEARSENVPIVHIVGYFSAGPNDLRKLRQVQIGSLDQVVAYSSVVVLGVCDCIAHAPAWIDAALRSCVVTGRPVYIGIPMVYAKWLVDGSGLGSGMDKTVMRGVSRNDPTRDQHVAEVVLRYLQLAKDAVVIVDGGVVRQGIQDVVRELVVRTGLPTFVTLEGREAIDAKLPNHGGLYAGFQSAPGVKERVDEADLLMHVGPCKSHVNAQYLHYLRFPNKIEINVDEHLVGRTMSYGVSSRGLLTAVLARLDQITISPGPIPPSSGIGDPLDKITLGPDSDDDSTFTKHDVYPRILKWMRDGDFLINHFSISDAQNRVHHAIWERKDVAFAACLGVAMASKETTTARRILVFLDAQYCKHASHELMTILELGLTPIVCVSFKPSTWAKLTGTGLLLARHPAWNFSRMRTSSSRRDRTIAIPRKSLVCQNITG